MRHAFVHSSTDFCSNVACKLARAAFCLWGIVTRTRSFRGAQCVHMVQLTLPCWTALHCGTLMGTAQDYRYYMLWLAM